MFTYLFIDSTEYLATHLLKHLPKSTIEYKRQSGRLVRSPKLIPKESNYLILVSSHKSTFHNRPCKVNQTAS